jgi:hypothetical protein
VGTSKRLERMMPESTVRTIQINTMILPELKYTTVASYRTNHYQARQVYLTSKLMSVRPDILAELPQLRHASLPATADFEFKSPAINTHFQTGFQITRPGYSNFPNKIKTPTDNCFSSVEKYYK